MDDPIQDCEHVIRSLTQGSSKEQEAAVNTYCTPNFNFIHPFCRTGSFEGSRLVYLAILRWYKIMSPKIDLTINSIAFDETQLILYVNISQVFAIWFVPFHRAPVNLTTKLQLVRPPNSRKYYIKEQNDLYQVDQFVRFFAPWGIGTSVVYFWHFWATIFCVILAILGAPFTWLEQAYAEKRQEDVKKDAGKLVDDVARGVRHGFNGSVDKISSGFEVDTGMTEEKQQFGSMQVIKPD